MIERGCACLTRDCAGVATVFAVLCTLLTDLPGTESQSGNVSAPQDNSSLQDEATLLAFKAGGDADGVLASWEASTSPCDAEGWNNYSTGWYGIKCDGEGGRVTADSRLQARRSTEVHAS